MSTVEPPLGMADGAFRGIYLSEIEWPLKLGQNQWIAQSVSQEVIR